jgi:hypothetical protein
MSGKKIEYQGNSYEMIKLLAQEYEVDYQHLRKLLKRGWSVDDAMEICLKKVYGIGKLYEYDGNLYRSPKKLAQEYKLPESSLKHFLAKCDSVEEAVNRCREEQEKQIVLWGKNYKNKEEVAEKFGISFGSLAYYTNAKSKSLEEAVITQLKKEPIKFEGNEYSSFIELCTEYGVQPANVMERITGYGKTLSEAIYTPVRTTKNGIAITYQNKSYSSHIGLCRDYNISKLLVSGLHRYAKEKDFLECFILVKKLRDECGWSENQLFTYIPMLKIEGVFYRKLPEFAWKIGMTSGQISTYKTRRKCNDIIETLKEMQKETICKYETAQGVFKYKELNEKGLQYAQIKEYPKIEIPRYPKLQLYNFENDCMDIQSRYKELFDKKKERVYIR